MTHPLFKKEIFVETAFARRFQKMLQDAWDNRSWHLLVADPGAGKTMSIRDLQKRAGGRSVLAVVAPKNNDDEQALGDQFLAALGLPIRGHWSTRKPKLMGHLHQYGVITFFRTIFPAKPSQIENEPGNSPLSRKQSLLASCVRTCSRER
jgi:superfamily II DNA or RNA helicase